jgi:hypothetical protein
VSLRISETADRSQTSTIATVVPAAGTALVLRIPFLAIVANLLTE